jgi:hypothetical protein
MSVKVRMKILEDLVYVLTDTSDKDNVNAGLLRHVESRSK